MSAPLTTMVLETVQTLALAVAWVWVAQRIFAKWLADPSPADMFEVAPGTYVQKRSHLVRQVIATCVITLVLWSVLISAVLVWLPKQPHSAQQQQHANAADHATDEVLRSRGPGEVTGWAADPLADADTGATEAQLDQRSPQVWIIAECYDRDQRGDRGHEERLIPPASAEFFQLNHGAPSPVRSRQVTVHGGAL